MQSIAVDISRQGKYQAPRRFDDHEPREILDSDYGRDEEVDRNGIKVMEVRSILKLQISVLGVDEIHLIRNPSNLNEAVYRVAENSDFTIGMTATLVYTSPTVSDAHHTSDPK